MALTKATYSMIEDAPVNARDFGAVGDGVADDTSAIQSAADFCEANDKILYVPSGNYLISNTININQISVECEDAAWTRFTANGNFTAFKIIATRQIFRNFNVWFTPPVNASAVAYQFGDGASQFNRNIVENFYARHASTAFYNASDMWGNVFTQTNSDFCINGYDFTATPSGTTNSFRNLYATGLKTSGAINASSNTLTVTDATNLRIGLTVAVIGAGASGPLVTAITGVSGNTITLAANAAVSVVDAAVFVKGKAFHTQAFSDTHIYNGYIDNYASFGAGSNSAVYTTDAQFSADSIRFEACAVLGANYAFIDDRSNTSNIGAIISFAHYVDAGAGNTAYLYRCGTGGLTQHTIGEISLVGFSYKSGLLKKAFLINNDQLLIGSSAATVSDSDDNGFTGGLFRVASSNRILSAAPTNGSWDTSDTYTVRAPVAGGQTGGICLSAGTFGTLNGGATTATTISGSACIIVNSVNGLSRNTFINIAGVAGTFKVIDVQSWPTNYVLLSEFCNASVTGAAVSFATPTFVSSGITELTASTAWDPGSINVGASETTTITVNGARIGDYVIASFDQSLLGMALTAFVASANLVGATLSNNTSTPRNLPSGILRVRVIKP